MAKALGRGAVHSSAQAVAGETRDARTRGAGSLLASEWLPTLAPLAAVFLLSLALNTWDLSKAGLGNTYYASAIRSMTMSWKNFFFGSFDPGGFITVDKPPVFLWIDALSARAFGFGSWQILLPSAIAGASSVALLWVIVRRYFGTTAATVAGIVLALTPITVMVDRLNLPEPFMVLALIGSAGATLRSIDSRRWWAWAAAAGALAGVAFNVKMLAGWVPGPAFAAAMVTGTIALTRVHLRRLLGKLALLALVTLVVSASWLVVVDAWPAASRPYIGGSTDNTVINLVLGYNGFGRVDGSGQAIGGGIRGTGFGGIFGPGGIIGGLPNLLRMFDPANGGQIGWLLLFALGSGVAVFWLRRRDPGRRSYAVLFLGWVLLYGAVFSYARGIYHSYYTSAMAPGIAALTGAGVVELARAVQRNRRWLFALAALLGGTVWVQLVLENREPSFYGWERPVVISVALAGAAFSLLFAMNHEAKRLVTGSVMLGMAGLLILPGSWAVSSLTQPAVNATLPQAGPHGGAAGFSFGSEAYDAGTVGLFRWLDAHRNSGTRWDLAVYNAQIASRFITHGYSLMTLGGFLGKDNTITIQGFANDVQSGDVRYVLTSGVVFNIGTRTNPFAPSRQSLAGAANAASRVIIAASEVCTVVNDATIPRQYRGQVYDCAGHADGLRALSG